MTDPEIEREIRRFKRAKLVEPNLESGEYVYHCHWSRTGWAVWRKNGGCTCNPARDPQTPRGDGESEQC